MPLTIIAKGNKKIVYPQFVPHVKDFCSKGARKSEEKALSFATHLANIFKPFSTHAQVCKDEKLCN